MTARTQGTAAVARHAGAPPRRIARPGPRRPRLALVPPMRATAPRAPFVLLIGALLSSGLGLLLFLHTALAEDSFRLERLQASSALLADQEQALEQSLARQAAPGRLAGRASALGMVASENPAFIRLSDGRVLGKPKAGVAPPPPPAPSPSASASPTASAKAAGHSGGKPGPRAQGQRNRNRAGRKPAPRVEATPTGAAR
jgi:hypothetical protein